LKIILIINLFFLSGINLFGQSMTEIFRLLPEDCTPELDAKQRDTLLQTGTYILPGGDSLETIEYELDSSGFSDYLRYGFHFTTGQNAFLSIELRKFKKADGGILIVYSRIGGMLRAYDQHDIFIFDYKNSKLTLSKQKLLPMNVPIKDFLKKGTPDSIEKKIKSYVMATYSLHPENPRSISFILYPGAPLGDMEKYLLSDSMTFTWNGRSFARKLVLQKE